MNIIILWLLLGGAVAVIANSKGFDTVGWLVYGALVPPIALAHVLVKPAVPKALTEPDPDQGLKRCPDCAEMVKSAAAVCRFCGNREFPATSVDHISEESDEWFSTIDTAGFNIKPVVPPLTTRQKLWWNENARDRRG